MENEDVVIDTNVLLSSTLSENGVSRQAVIKAMEDYTIIQSAETFDEFVEVINREKFDKFLSQETREEIINDLANASEFLDVTHQTNACRDPKDNRFLELAVSGKAKYLISGDEDLLSLGEYNGIPIVTPRRFLELEREREQKEERDQAEETERQKREAAEEKERLRQKALDRDLEKALQQLRERQQDQGRER
jgi:putative PIN family toxin of toxin-antitoxin system